MEENLEGGGLKMVTVVNLQKAFHLQWVWKLAKSGEEKWTLIPRWWFSKLASGLGVFNFTCRFKDVKGLNKIGNGFWNSFPWTYLNAGKLTTENEIDSESVYFQQHNFGTNLSYTIIIIYYFTLNGKGKALNTLKTSQKTMKNEYIPQRKWNRQ